MAILPDRTELTTPADGDLYVTTDVSDTTDAATGTDKKITWASIKAGLKTYFDTLYAGVLGADDNYVTDAEKAALHAAVTVADSSEIDLTLTGQQISASIVAGSIDETKLDVSVNASLDLADSAVQPSTSPLLTTVELGHATDTTISRVSAGVIAVEGVTVPTISSTSTLTNKDISSATNKRPIVYYKSTLNGSTALTTADVDYFRIPAALGGMNLVSVAASVGTGAAGSSSSGTPTFTVTNVTQTNAAMLSTALTVDANEYTSATAAVAAVIDTANDDVATDDLLKIAVTTAGTGVTYAQVVLGFQLP